MQILPQGSSYPPPAGQTEAAQVRDFVPSSGPLANNAQHVLIFGAYQSTEQQIQREPWAWDPILYYLGAFDGTKMDLRGGKAQYESIMCNSPACYAHLMPPVGASVVAVYQTHLFSLFFSSICFLNVS
jgi:hypothetical protein